MYKQKTSVVDSSVSVNHPSVVPFARLTLLACMVSLAACGGSGGSGDAKGDANLQTLGAEGSSTNSDGQSVEVPAIVDVGNVGAGNGGQVDAVVATTENQTEPAQLPDFFGKQLEIDTEQAVAGGPPTKPKNLHVNLLGNDWVELLGNNHFYRLQLYPRA